MAPWQERISYHGTLVEGCIFDKSDFLACVLTTFSSSSLIESLFDLRFGFSFVSDASCTAVLEVGDSSVL